MNTRLLTLVFSGGDVETEREVNGPKRKELEKICVWV